MPKKPTVEKNEASIEQYHGRTSTCSAESVADHIRMRAYQLFEARGCQPGQELDDWLQAEREIKHHMGLPLQ